MSLQDQIIRQRDFTSGEVDPDAIRRDDLEFLKAGIRYGRNIVATHTGGLTRRPGRRLLFEDTGIVRDFKPFNDVVYSMVFIGGAVKVRTDTGALVATLTAPWTAEDLDDLVTESVDNELFVAWGGQPQVIKIAEGTNVWTISAFAFETGLDGSVRTPFHRFESSVNITMQPSGLTGNIFITFSAPFLTPAHVGVILRYGGRQLRVTGYLSATVGMATVIQELPPTYVLQVDSSIGFSIGQIVETDTTNMKGEVVAAPGANVWVVLIDKVIVPQVGERLVGPTAASKITAVSNSPTPQSAVQWDEQFISGYRGYPRSVSKDRQRLIFCDFPQKKNAIFWSATGNTRDGEIGADADNAMLEFITAECQIYHVVGGYDEFITTDKGVYFVPISVGAPLQPGSVEFRPIFNSELSKIRPIEVTEGLIFVDKSQTGIYAISATGQTARPYIANEINRYHRHLFNGVKSIAATAATKEFPSRQIYTVNEDGTYVVGQYNPDSEYIGWLKQEGAGSVISVAGGYGKVIFMSVYTFGGVDYGVAEELDHDLLCDCASTLGTDVFADFLELNNGAPLLLNASVNLDLSGVIAGFYAGKTVSVFAGGFYFGQVVVPVNGVIAGFDDYAEITIGVDFEWSLHPLFPRFEGGQPVGQGERRRKIEKMMLTVHGTQEFQCGNRKFGSYRGGDDTAEPVPERDDTYKYREVGRSYDPDVEIRSTFPGTFNLIELFTRITV